MIQYAVLLLGTRALENHINTTVMVQVYQPGKTFTLCKLLPRLPVRHLGF